MNVFSYRSYQAVLEEAVKEKRLADGEFNFQKLADITGIQKSYLSKVRNKKAHLSADQAFGLAEQFGLSEEETEYFILLVEYERTAIDSRRRYLLKQIDRVYQEHRKSDRHVQVKTRIGEQEATLQYYSVPWVQIVHLGLTIERFRRSPQDLATALGVPRQTVADAIEILIRMGLAERKGKSIVSAEDPIHLSKDSPVYPVWRNQLKLLSLNRLSLTPDGLDYSFGVTFSATETVREQIQQRFFQFLKAIEREVKGAASQEVYQLNFDLFSWTKP